MACRKFYRVEGKLTLNALSQLLLKQMGIAEISPYPSGSRARGMYFKDEDQVIMLVRPDDSPEARLFTLAHELREVIGAFFHDLHPRMVDESGDDLEMQADAFASTLILGEDAFRYSMAESGLDPVRLGYMYNRSCVTVIRRIIRTLAGPPNPIPFWAAIYERRPGIPKNCLYSAGAHRSPKFSRSTRDELPNALFVGRGHLLRIHDSLRQALRYSRTVYIESVTGLDLWNSQPLTAVIRPHKSYLGIDRLIVIAVPRELAKGIRDRVMQCRPMALEETFQEI